MAKTGEGYTVKYVCSECGTERKPTLVVRGKPNKVNRIIKICKCNFESWENIDNVPIVTEKEYDEEMKGAENEKQ
jgi:hypothetical protein